MSLRTRARTRYKSIFIHDFIECAPCRSCRVLSVLDAYDTNSFEKAEVCNSSPGRMEDRSRLDESLVKYWRTHFRSGVAVLQSPERNQERKREREGWSFSTRICSCIQVAYKDPYWSTTTVNLREVRESLSGAFECRTRCIRYQTWRKSLERRIPYAPSGRISLWNSTPGRSCRLRPPRYRAGVYIRSGRKLYTRICTASAGRRRLGKTRLILLAAPRRRARGWSSTASRCRRLG